MSIASCIRKHASALRAAGIDPATLGTPQAVQEALGSANELLADVSKEIESKLPQETMLQEDEEGGTIRGAFTPAYKGSPPTITLTDDMSLSSFIHESGHFFMESYINMAPNSPTIAKEVDILFKFLGVEGGAEAWGKMTDKQKSPFNEKMARHFEAYFMEGKAPSFELQPVFNQLRQFVLATYKTIKGLIASGGIDINLSNDVRLVFDRMLATDEALQQKQVADSYLPIFENQEESGQTEKEYQAYVKVNEARETEATQELDIKTRKDWQWLSNARDKEIKKQQSKNRGKRKAMRADVEAELNQTPVYKVINYIKESGSKLSKQEWMETFTGTTPPKAITSPSGKPSEQIMVESDTASDFKSPEEMMKSLIKAAHTVADKNKRIDAVTDMRMMQKYGDINSKEAMDAAVTEALHNKAHTRHVHSELRALTKATTGEKNILHRAAKMIAERAIGKRKFKNIKPHLFAQAEERAGRNAYAATKSGDTELAIEHKRAQVLNDHFYRAAKNGKEQALKDINFVKKYQRPSIRKHIARDYLDQIDAIMERISLKIVTAKKADRRVAYLKWHNQQVAKELPIVAPADYLESLKKSYQNMTLDEISQMRQTIENIAHLGKLKQTIIVGQGTREFNKAIQEGVAVSKKENPTQWDPENLMAKRFPTAGKVTGGLKASLVKIEFLAEQLDGDKPNGIWWNMLFRPIADAENMEIKLREELKNPALKIIKSGFFKNSHKKVKIGTKTFTMDQLRSMALNFGNEYNINSLLEGLEKNNQGITRADLERAFDQHMTKENWNTVEDMWALIHSYWPQISDLQYKITGVRPEEVSGDAFETKHGTIKGGYYPLLFDSEHTWSSFFTDKSMWLNEKLDTEQILAQNMTYAQTKQGHIKSRTNSGGAMVRTDTNVIWEHLNNVIHDLAFREAIISVNKVINHGDAAKEIGRVAGPQMAKQVLKEWLQTVASGDRQQAFGVEKLLRLFRKNATIVGMGIKMTTAIVQPLGYTQSIEYLGAHWARIGLQQFLANPGKNWKDVMADSAMMRQRINGGMDRDINDALKIIKQETGVTHIMQEYAFKHIAYMDMVVSMPTYLGAYAKAKSAKLSDVDAVAQAEKAVRMTQSSGNAKDLAQIASGNEYKKLFTMFWTYFSSQLALTRRSYRMTGRKVNLKSLSRFTMSMMLLSAIPAVLSELVVGRWPDEDEDEEWVSWAAKEAIAYPFMAVPYLRDWVNSEVRGYKYSPTAAFGIWEAASDTLDDVRKLFDGYELEETQMDKNFLMLSGYILGLPSRQIHIILENFEDILEGEELTPAQMLMLQKNYDR